ncbi:MAG: hypothetical protein AAGC71_06410 [Pseudomonadota bacterium]
MTTNNNSPTDKPTEGFFRALLGGLLRDAGRLVIAFIVGTGAGAIVCWYYSLPMILSVAGGILVVALIVLFWFDGGILD